MADDNLLDDDDLLGIGEFDEEIDGDLDESLLDDEIPTKKPKLSNESIIPKIESMKENDKEPEKPTASSSLEKIEQEIAFENEALDYEDDLEDFDEKERRESKFASERTEKPTNIESILPQQKNSIKTDGETTAPTNFDSGRGRGGYRGRGRGNWRPRGGSRMQNHQFPGVVDGRPNFYPNGVPFYPPFPVMNPGLSGPGVVPPFMPNMPPPFMHNDQSAWNKRVEAFMRQTAGSDVNNVGRSRSYSVSSSGSSCSTCSSSSRSGSRSRSPRRDRKPTNRRNDKRAREATSSKKSPTDDKKTALECAEAIGLDEEYLKKVEEQKRLREEIQQKKMRKFTEDNDEVKKPNEKDIRKRDHKRTERSPKKTDRSPTRREKNHRHRHHKKHHRRERASSLERLAEQALKAANAAINPLPTMNIPILPTGLPSFNVPPPALPVRPIIQMPDVTKPPPILQQQLRQPPPQVPALRTVSTTTMVAPNMPKIVTHEPPLDAKEKKLKAQLVVVVEKIGKLTNGLKRISLFATSVGDIKKVWQTEPDSVSIIFQQLKDAKTFMTQYHNQPISGVRLEVSLHKMYLNLDTIP